MLIRVIAIVAVIAMLGLSHSTPIARVDAAFQQTIDSALAELTEPAHDLVRSYTIYPTPDRGSSCDNIFGVIRIDASRMELGETATSLTVHELAHAWWGPENVIWGFDHLGKLLGKRAGMNQVERTSFSRDFDRYCRDTNLDPEEHAEMTFIKFQVHVWKEDIWPSDFHLDAFIYRNPRYPEAFAQIASRIVRNEPVPDYLIPHFSKLLVRSASRSQGL